MLDAFLTTLEHEDQDLSRGTQVLGMHLFSATPHLLLPHLPLQDAQSVGSAGFGEPEDQDRGTMQGNGPILLNLR